MPNREIATVESCIAEARQMQESGRYINGTIFHMLADEVERLRASQERLKSAIEFAHSEGFQWPSDPMAEFAQPEQTK